MTEKEKMIAGECYSAIDPQLLEELVVTQEILVEYNALPPADTQRKQTGKVQTDLRKAH